MDGKCIHLKLDEEEQQNSQSDLLIYNDSYEFLRYSGEKISETLLHQWKNDLAILFCRNQNHQNVVRYFTVDKCNPKDTVIITELYDGTLETCVQANRIDLPILSTISFNEKDQILQYKSIRLVLLKQIAQGIHHLHTNDIIHCNVRPSNVFLFNNSQNILIAKLGRLTYCKKVDKTGSCTVTEEFLKSLPDQAYLAPEALYKKRKMRKVSDVYSLGILMYYTLSERKHPFQDTSKKTHSLKNCKGNPKKAAKFTDLRNKQNSAIGFEQEKWITVVDLIKRMIVSPYKQRLEIEDVLWHPTFYQPQKKLDFFLKVYESIKPKGEVVDINSPLYKKINKALTMYNQNLMEDGKKESIPFCVKRETIFEKHDYFLKGRKDSNDFYYFLKERKDSNDFCRKNKKIDCWVPLEDPSRFGYCNNVRSLLRYLRNVVVHACEKPPRVPQDFKNDFRGKKKDSYFPQQFLNVFFSTLPQLLVHLYEKYKNFEDLAAEFYHHKM